MKRIGAMGVLMAAMSGCMSADSNHEIGHGCGCSGTAATVPGVQGPWGQPVTITQTSASMPASAPSGVVQAGGACPDGKCVVQAGFRAGAAGPAGPIPTGHAMPAGPGTPPGVVAGVGMMVGPPPPSGQRSSVRFLRPEGMKVSWYVPSPDGRPTFSSTQLDTPGRYNFTQGAIYRLKLSHLPNRPNIVALYPTLEVAPANNKTAAFLAHSAVPLVFTDEDFDQVAAGNYLVKVVYLPDPQFQDVATAGPDEVVSTRLDPGVDPVAEARRRGTVLLVIRMGNIDLEAPNTPSMEAPNPYMMPPMPRQLPPNGRPLPMAPHGPMSKAPQGPITAPQAMARPMDSSIPVLPPAGSVTNKNDWTPPPGAPSSTPTTPGPVTTLPAPLDAPPSVAGSATISTTPPPQDSSFERRPSLRRRLFSGSSEN
jgi:hypothetical protein